MTILSTLLLAALTVPAPGIKTEAFQPFKTQKIAEDVEAGRPPWPSRKEFPQGTCSKLVRPTAIHTQGGYKGICHITQVGIDGFGHQLQGTLTVMSLHGLPRTLAIGNTSETYLNETFKYGVQRNRSYVFDHISPGSAESTDLEAFMTRVNERFVQDICPDCVLPPDKFCDLPFTHEIHMIPTKREDRGCRDNLIYAVDNAFKGAWGPVELSERSARQKAPLVANLLKTTAMVGKLLPATSYKMSSSTWTVVAHFRFGDATTRTLGITKNEAEEIRAKLHEEQVKEITTRLATPRERVATTRLIVHTDDKTQAEASFPGVSNIVIHGESEPILTAISDMVFADSFVGTDSSISCVAVYLRVGMGKPDTATPYSHNCDFLPVSDTLKHFQRDDKWR